MASLLRHARALRRSGAAPAGSRLLSLAFCSSAAAAASDSSVANSRSHRLPSAHNFSFSGCGFLIPYHLGVAQGLQDAGYIQESSKFAGASGGAIAALTLAANVSMAEIQTEAKAMAELCHSHGTLWKLEARLRRIFHKKFDDLPVDALAKRLTIATEKMWPARALVLTDEFDSTDDLCDALIASCYVPWYLAPRGTSLFRGEYHVDGGILTLVPEIPGYVKVCAFHAHLIRRDDYEISPSLDPDFPYTIMQLFRFAMFPPETEVLDEFFELGKKAAGIWAEKQTAADTSRLQSVDTEEQTAGQSTKDDTKLSTDRKVES